MFPTNLDVFKTYQKELHHRAAQYRLVKSLEQPDRWAHKIVTAVGRILIITGQALVNRTSVAH